MVSNALANRPVELAEWGVMREQAKVLVSTGFLPAAIKTPEQALAIMLKGRELNVPPMYALSNITVLQGKPTAGAELMLALIYRDHGDDAIRFKESTAERCVVTYRRRSWASPETFAFTIEDAKRAGLTQSPTWQKYTPALLRARCVSAVARMAFADSIGGMYTPEELGARVTVNDHDEMSVVLDESELETIPEVQQRFTQRAQNAPELPASRPADPEPTPEPAEGEYTETAPEPPDDDDRLPIAKPVEESPLRGECRALFLKMQQWDIFRAIKLPPDEAPDAKWNEFLDVWGPKVGDAERAAERRAQTAAGKGR